MHCVRSGGRRWSSSFRRRPEHAGRAFSKDALTIDLYGSERIIDRGGLPMRLCLALVLLAAPLCAPLYESGALAQEANGLRPGIAPEDAAVQGPRRAPVADDDSYAPRGIRASGFILYPSPTVGTGYTTNAAGVAGGSGSGIFCAAISEATARPLGVTVSGSGQSCIFCTFGASCANVGATGASRASKNIIL